MSEKGNAIEVLQNRLGNLEDKVDYALAELRQQLTRLENSPGAQGAVRQEQIEERLAVLEGDDGETDDVVVATAEDVDFLGKRIDALNTYSDEGINGVSKELADLKSRVDKVEKAAAKPAQTPNGNPTGKQTPAS